MDKQETKNNNNYIIINGEIYKAINGSPFCKDCAFENKHIICNGLCEFFEKLVGNYFTFCIFQKVKKDGEH